MKNRQVLELASYRIQQAHDSLNEAAILAREESWPGTINRAYYAMFYSVLALTVVSGFSTSKHAGVLAFFDREYVKPGVFPKELSKKFHLAFDRRQTQDYGEFVLAHEPTAVETLSHASEFVAAIGSYLSNSVFPGLQSKPK